MFIRPDLVAVALAAILFTAGPSTASLPGGRCGRFYDAARTARTAADVAAKRGDQRTANARLDDALRTLGTHYHTREMIDDSDMHLLVARQAVAGRRWKQAVAIKRNVLSGRLRLCTMG